MSTVEKLLVRGIRSFSPTNEDKIEFFRPLTLIVGTNGAGKTTIIECLKMALSGDLPPNCQSGQAFVQDPKVAGEREVKAQIKLRARTLSGRRVVVVRSFELTQRPTKLEYRNSENVLSTRTDGGERVSKSMRCSDLDKELPMLMGVSRSILENVIFCHQENSNWPLEDPRTLKQKFDDIFSATRYTKALAAIKEFRKAQVLSIKDHHINLREAQVRREEAQKRYDELEADRKKMEETGESMEHVQEEIDTTQAEIETVLEEESHIQAIENELRTMANHCQLLETHRDNLYANLDEEAVETDEELQGILDDFTHAIGKLTEEKAALERKNESLIAEQDLLNTRKNDLSREHGRLMALEQAQIDNVRIRNEMTERLVKRHGIGLAKDPTENEVQALQTQLRRQVDEMRREAEALARANRAVTDKIQEEITSFNRQLTATDEQIRINASERTRIRSHISRVTADMERMSVSDNTLQAVERRLKTAEEALHTERSRASLDTYEHRINEIKSSLVDVTTMIQEKAEQLKSVEHQNEQRIKINMRRAEMKNKKEMGDKLFEQRRNDFVDALGHETAQQDVESELASALGEKIRLCEQAARDLKRVETEEIDLRGKQDMTQKTLDSIQRHMDECRRAFIPVCREEEDVPALLQEYHDKIMTTREELKMADTIEKVHQRLLKTGRENNFCPLCEKGFVGEDLHLFTGVIEEIISRVPNKKRELAQQERTLEEKEGRLKSVQRSWEQFHRLRNEELPSVEGSFRDLSSRCTQLNEDRRKIQKECDACKEAEEGIRALLLDAERVSKAHQEYCAIESEIFRDSQWLDPEGGGEDVSVVTLREEYDHVQARRNDLNTSLDTVRKEYQEKQRSLSKMSEEVSRLQQERNDVKSKVEEKERVAREHKDLLERDAVLRRDIEEFRKAMAPLQEKVKRKATELEGEHTRAIRVEGEQDTEINKCERSVTDLEQMNRKCQLYSEQGTERRLKEVEEELVKLEEDVEENRRKIGTTIHRLEEMNAMVSDEKSLERKIRDNIKYREVVRDIAKNAQCTKEKEEELNRHRPLTKVQDYLHSLTTHQNQLQQRLSLFAGNRESVVHHIRKLEQELNSPAYRNIDDTYRHLLIDVKTMEMANADLDKYHRALDRALMKYHQLKMEEINKTIRELWQATYHGSDIDTIEIAASDEGKASGSYNYKVVMRKGDAVMGMRGRCSAGQKVLASLIIRLALADSFSVNCGILALDEPTTNLDSANIEGFARALSDLVTQRTARSADHFQLLVITHDERFVQLLGRGEHADYFYRISKDESGQSRIKRAPINTLG